MPTHTKVSHIHLNSHELCHDSEIPWYILHFNGPARLTEAYAGNRSWNKQGSDDHTV